MVSQMARFHAFLLLSNIIYMHHILFIHTGMHIWLKARLFLPREREFRCSFTLTVRADASGFPLHFSIFSLDRGPHYKALVTLGVHTPGPNMRTQ